jgi:hypothetical protein
VSSYAELDVAALIDATLFHQASERPPQLAAAHRQCEAKQTDSHTYLHGGLWDGSRSFGGGLFSFVVRGQPMHNVAASAGLHFMPSSTSTCTLPAVEVSSLLTSKYI